MKKLCTIILLPLLLAACAISEFDLPLSQTKNGTEEADSMGFFELNLSTVQTTRSTTTYLSPEDFLVTIYKGSDLVRPTTRLGDLDTRLPAGYGYTIQAESCSETEAETADNGWGQKRFAGFSASFAVKAGETTPVDVGCSMANSGVLLFLEELTLSYFTSVQAVVKSGDRTLTITQAENGKIAFFNLPPDGERTVTYTITGTAEGENEPIVVEGTFTLEKAKVSRIKMKYDLGVLGLNIYVEKVTIEDAEAVIYDKDLKTDEGKTDINATFGGYTEGSKADISTYGQASVSLTATTPIDWSTSDNQVAVYDYTKDSKEAFAISDIGGVQRLTGNVTPKTRDFLAAYPYSQVADALSDGKVLFTLPAEQRAASVAPGTKLTSSNINYSVAKGQRNYDGSLLSMTFQPVCQMLQFQVPDYATGRIKAIQLTTNTALAGQLTVDCSGEKPATSITANGSNSLTILPPSGSTFAAGTYYILTAPVQFSGFTMSFQCEGTGYTLTSTSTIGGEAGKVYPLGYIDLVNIPTASTKCEYPNNILEGTSMILSNAPVPAKTWSVVVKKGGTSVRTVSGTNNLSSPETDSSWPYLPKGSYTVEYSYTTSNDKTISGNHIDFTITENPKLSLTVGGYSAHTQYEAGNVDAANGCDRKTVYNPSAKLNVAEKLFTNSNYSGLGSYSRTFNNGTAQEETATTNAPSWANYTNVAVSANLYRLSVTATFDGATATAYKDFRITGLPVKYEPPTKSDWTGHSKVSFEDSYVQLGHNAGIGSNPHYITCDDFCIPSGTKITLTYDFMLHLDAAAVTNTFTISAGDNKFFEETQTGSLFSGVQTNNRSGSKTITLSGQVTQMRCNQSYGLGQTYTNIKKLDYKYSK